MLIIVLRITFILLATLIGMTSGHFFYERVVSGMPVWFGAAMGFGMAVTLIAAEQAFRRRFARSLVAFLIGLAAGLSLSWLVLSVLSLVLQNHELYNNLDLPVTLMTTYLVMITVLRNIDRWRMVIPFVEFRSQQVQGGALVVDASILADGRLLGLLRSGLITERVLIHRRVIHHLEQAAGAVDPVVQAKARRSLDGLSEIRALAAPRVEVDDSEVPNAEHLDEILVRLARLENGRLASNDQALLSRAQAEGVPVVDLNALATLFSSSLRQGESLRITIEKAGEGKGQGVGFLADGSMVVVANAADRVGQTLHVTVLRTLNTANGRMVFAETHGSV